MEYRSFIVRDHVAHDVVEQLAEEGLMQFVDVSSLRLPRRLTCLTSSQYARCKETRQPSNVNSHLMCAAVANWKAF